MPFQLAAGCGGVVQRGEAEAVAPGDVGTAVADEDLNGAGVAEVRGVVQRRGAATVRVVGVGAAAEELQGRARPAVLRRLEQRALPYLVAAVNVCASLQQNGHPVRVPSRCCTQQLSV